MAKRKPKGAAPRGEQGPTEFDDFLASIQRIVDQGSLSKALSMLRKERFQLYAEVSPDFASGLVRSQSSKKRVYACRLAATGCYSCCTQNLIQCVLSSGSPCKHLLVLVMGLVRAGDLPAATALAWLKSARTMGRTRDGYRPDKEVVTATFLKFKGVEAGTVDWRPTETIPEDFYAM